MPQTVTNHWKFLDHFYKISPFVVCIAKLSAVWITWKFRMGFNRLYSFESPRDFSKSFCEKFKNNSWFRNLWKTCEKRIEREERRRRIPHLFVYVDTSCKPVFIRLVLRAVETQTHLFLSHSLDQDTKVRIRRFIHLLLNMTHLHHEFRGRRWKLRSERLHSVLNADARFSSFFDTERAI